MMPHEGSAFLRALPRGSGTSVLALGQKKSPHRRSVVAMGDGIVSAKWIDAYFSGVIKTSTLSPVESKPFMKAAIFSGVNALTVFS